MSVAEVIEAPSAEFGTADCVAFVSDNQTHAVVASVAPQFFSDPLVRDGNSRDALHFMSDAPPPKLMIVDIGETSDPLSAMLSLTTAFTGEMRLIGIGTINDIGLYRELIEAGVTDYLVKPVTERALATALSRAEENPLHGEPVAGETPRIAVIGARGGVGASTLAVNLAWIFAEEDKRKTALVDLDLEFGTVALSLDLEPTRGLREALENPARIDDLFISSATAKLSEQLSVMATEESLTEGIPYENGAIDILFDALCRSNDYLVVDLPRPSIALRQAVLHAASNIVLVSELNLPGLRDSIRLLGAIEETAPETPVTIVGNRASGPQQAMQIPDFEKALGRKVEFQVPDEPKAFNEAANTGRPLVSSAPRSKAAKAMRRLANTLSTERQDAAGKKGGLRQAWSRWVKRG